MKLIEIENRAGKVKISKVIDEGTMDSLIDQMATLYGDDAVRNQVRIGDIVAVASDSLKSLEIEINSPGGSIKQGYRAYKTIMELRERGVYVTARITKLAASMGSILAVAADKVMIESGAKMMLHDAATVAWGNADEMLSAHEMLNAVSNELASIYSERMGKSVSEVRGIMKKETWMDAKQAVALKLADEIYTKEKTAEKPKSKLERILDGEKTKAEFDSEEKGMSIFARLLSNDSEIVAKLDAMVDENATLSADLESAQAKITELTGLVEVNAQLQGDLSGAQSKVAELEASATASATKITELESTAVITAEKVSIRAAELLATQGHPAPVSLAGDAPDEEDKAIKNLTGFAKVSASFAAKQSK